MKTKLIAALFAVAFGLCGATVAIAADTAKSEDAKAPMYYASCPPSCDFTVKSHDKAEVIAILKEHAKSHHDGMILTDEQAEAMVKTK